MWVFVKDAFFSVVQDRGDADRLMVRARFPGDLERHFPEAKVLEHGPGEADYRFRAFLPREQVEAWLQGQIQAVNYPDFKSQVPVDHGLRYRAYMGVWETMNEAQRVGREYSLSDLLDSEEMNP
ncbi:MAG: hypothetical protein ACOC0M_00375 [Halomonas sp.]